MKKEDTNLPGGRKKKPLNIEITELFMAKKGKNGWAHCFHGTIHREKDENGKEIAVNSKLYLKDEGYIWSRDVNQDECGENLDEMVELRLDHNIHDNPGVTVTIAESKFYVN
ncbi:MAG: hypothetical protein WAW07_16525 [Bacteroidales bacterium]